MKKRLTILQKMNLWGSSAHRFKLNLFFLFNVTQIQQKIRLFYDTVRNGSAELNLNSVQ